ncbi:hypothetical protein BV133_3042 [Blastochloris viridis]|uniref:Uncharacterized protein n=1 Tax=Blastochloris viridis TaxID=1079 RepID=A0A182D5D4_BLAVI|nr:hypothetical protein BV133_3042 [Blastochloris viridis]
MNGHGRSPGRGRFGRRQTAAGCRDAGIAAQVHRAGSPEAATKRTLMVPARGGAENASAVPAWQGRRTGLPRPAAPAPPA